MISRTGLPCRKRSLLGAEAVPLEELRIARNHDRLNYYNAQHITACQTGHDISEAPVTITGIRNLPVYVGNAQIQGAFGTHKTRQLDAFADQIHETQ
jgi:hypothetical protein